MPCVILLKNITIVFGEGKSNSGFHYTCIFKFTFFIINDIKFFLIYM